jgi:hypothetical protein
MGAGRPAISGLASTRMSLFSSMSAWPAAKAAASLVMVPTVSVPSATETSPVACQFVTQPGSASADTPCTPCSMLSFVNAPTAGAVV